MKTSISAHTFTRTALVSFGDLDGTTVSGQTSDGMDIWFSGDGRLVCAVIDLECVPASAEAVLGPDWGSILRMVVEHLQDSEEVEVVVDLPDMVRESHSELHNQFGFRLLGCLATRLEHELLEHVHR